MSEFGSHSTQQYHCIQSGQTVQLIESLFYAYSRHNIYILTSAQDSWCLGLVANTELPTRDEYIFV